MKKYILALLSLTILASCGVEQQLHTPAGEPIIQEVTEESKVISISSSIVPISSIINTIGGDFVDVNTIIPAGVSPHGFDLSPKDVVALEDSQLTFIIGLEQIDGFLEKALEGKTHVELAIGMDLIEATAHDHSEHENDEHNDEDEDDEHSDEHGGEANHDEHSIDVHVWLGKDNIIQIANTIRDELSATLPEHAEYFSKNTQNFKSELQAMYADFTEKHIGKTPKEFIVFHDAYNYMIESLGININLKVPFSENILHDTSTAHLAELIEEIELHGLKNVFTEPQFSDTNIKDFATEYELTLGILDPLGTDDSAGGYLVNMKSNLDNISRIYD